MDKYIGRLLDNRYEILEIIGTGGMAVVYKARCHRLNRLVAIKILKDDYLEDEEFRRRFHSESQAVAMLSHSNIVSIYDVSSSVTADYIVMELIDGITLKQYMEKKGVLNWKETLHFAIQISKALEHAHSRGIVHRDIKPHNVMVLKNGSVKVTDFGIARMMSKGNTLTKEALGSVHYISPEQARGGRVDSRSDIYSLGAVMYEMMSGRPPYDGESPVAVAIQHINGGAVMPSTLNPNIPGGLEQIIMKAMAHEPAERYASATQMLADLDEFRKSPAILFDYNTPPTDAVTNMPQPLVLEAAQKPTTAQRVERGSGERHTPRRTADRPQRRREPVKEEEKPNKTAMIAVIACSVVMVVAVVIFLVVLFSGGNDKVEMIEVPNLLGKIYENLPEYADVNVRIDKEIHHNSKPGQILEQSPKAGTQMEKGGTIYVVISLGKEGSMPDLVDWELVEAKKALNNLDMNLQIKEKEEHHDSIAEGKVTRTEPEAGVDLTEGQTVTIYVSKGMEIKNGLMPDVIGKNREAAEKILKDQNLALDIVIEEIYDSADNAGKVVRTDPEADKELKTGQKVTVYISKGQHLEKIQNLVGLSVNSAVAVLKEDGFENYEIKPLLSKKDRDTVVAMNTVEGTDITPNTELDVNTVIVLYVSLGPNVDTMKVTIPVSSYTKDGSIQLTITREDTGTSVYDRAVAQGTEEIILENQTGKGTVIYILQIDNDSDGIPYEWKFSYD